MQQSWFLRRSQTQQAAADPVQLQQVPEAVAVSFYGGSRLPFARLQNSPKLPKFPAAPRRHSAAVNLSCSSNKSLRPWQCPFMEVQGCRLPGFKTRQNSPNASLQVPGATQAAVILSCSSNKSLKPWQCPFMEVQGCRLPGFKTRLSKAMVLVTTRQAPDEPKCKIKNHGNGTSFC